VSDGVGLHERDDDEAAAEGQRPHLERHPGHGEQPAPAGGQRGGLSRGLGDRGGTCAIEEIAAVLEVYGVRTGIKLDALYDLATFTREAFGVTLAPWKPLVGENWNREEGLGHLSGATVSEASIGIAPEVLGRRFESGIGAKILFGRERSSATTSEPLFLKKLIAEWGLRVDEAGWQTILRRARAAVATSYTRHYLTIDEFRAICESAATA